MAPADCGSVTTRTPPRPPFTPLLKRTHGSLGGSPFVHLSHARTLARTPSIDQPSLRTSVDDGAAVVEDDPALVQGGDGVEEVEGPQIPLKTPTKDRFTLSLSLICIS